MDCAITMPKKTYPSENLPRRKRFQFSPRENVPWYDFCTPQKSEITFFFFNIKDCNKTYYTVNICCFGLYISNNVPTSTLFNKTMTV